MWHSRGRAGLAAAVVLLAAVLGCGYSFLPGLTNIPPGAESIGIEVFKNNTPEPGIETDFTNDLVLEFNRSHVLKVVAPPGDLTMSGAIDNLVVNPVSYSAEVIAVQRRLDVRVSAKLTDAHTGKVIWADPAMVETEVFSVSSSPQVTAENRRTAIQAIAERIAFQIFNRSLEGF